MNIGDLYMAFTGADALTDFHIYTSWVEFKTQRDPIFIGTYDEMGLGHELMVVKKFSVEMNGDWPSIIHVYAE